MSERDARGWSASDYAENAGFVPALGAAVLDLLAPAAGEVILDLGCGNGTLTERIAEAGADVLGVDASPDMLAAARARGLRVRQMDAQALAFDCEFDAVFSNAALHWMPDQAAVAAGVLRALKPGGRYVGECGGFQNVAAIRTALRAVLAQHGYPEDPGRRQVYHSVASFAELHRAAGFADIQAMLVWRPTPLPTGMRGWLQTFRGGLIDAAGAPPAEAQAIIAEVSELLRPDLCDSDGNWQADYVRLRWRARKPG